jgi:Rod binding domain-containing protein
MLQQESNARDAAMKLVSSSLVLPILSSIREGAFLEEPFKPGVMERRFGPLLDQAVADRITQSSGFDLVDSIVNQIQSQSNPESLEVFA